MLKNISVIVATMCSVSAFAESPDLSIRAIEIESSANEAVSNSVEMETFTQEEDNQGSLLTSWVPWAGVAGVALASTFYWNHQVNVASNRIGELDVLDPNAANAIQDANSQGTRATTYSMVSLGVASAAAITSVVFAVRGQRNNKETHSKRLSPMVNQHGAGVSFHSTF